MASITRSEIWSRLVDFPKSICSEFIFSALNGGFWGPYQVDEVIEEEEEDYGDNYEYDHYSETTEVQGQPEVPWTPLTLTSNNRK